MTREPPLNWVGVTFASSAPWTRVEDVVGDVEPELDEARADDGQHARRPGRRSRGSRRSGCRARPGRSSPSGTAGGSSRRVRKPNDRRGLDRRPALGRERVEVASRLADGPLRVLEERHLGLVPAPGAMRPARQRPSGADRRRAPDRHVAPLVVAVARLRPDVRAGQGDARRRSGTARPAGGAKVARPGRRRRSRASTATLIG